MWIRVWQWFRHNREFSFALLVAIILLVFRVSARAFWMDENMVLHYFKQGPLEFFWHYFHQPDNHPPLYYWAVLLVSKVLPWTEFTVRLVSMLSGVGLVTVTYLFAQRVFKNRQYAALAAFFTAFSAYFVLIGQMARYHSLTGFVALLCLYFFYQLYSDRQTRAWHGYLISLGVLGWIDYPHVIYLIVLTNAIYLVGLIKRNSLMHCWRWLKGQLVVAVALLPLTWLIFHRIVYQGDGGFDKMNLLANSGLSILGGILFHGYVYFFSENILPWNYTAFAAGILVLLVAGWQLLCAAREPGRGGVRFVAGLALFLIVLNTIFLNVANPRYNFTVYPKFVFVAYPLLIMALVGAVARIKTVRWRLVLWAVWGAVCLTGLIHFYQRVNYLNPSYFNTFAGFERVREHGIVGQYIILGPDMDPHAYEFYRSKYFANLTPVAQTELETVPRGAKLWFWSTGSDAPDRGVDPIDNVPVGYEILWRIDNVPLDPGFKKFKEYVLHRPSYTYKYSIFLLEKL